MIAVAHALVTYAGDADGGALRAEGGPIIAALDGQRLLRFRYVERIPPAPRPAYVIETTVRKLAPERCELVVTDSEHSTSFEGVHRRGSCVLRQDADTLLSFSFDASIPDEDDAGAPFMKALSAAMGS